MVAGAGVGAAWGVCGHASIGHARSPTPISPPGHFLEMIMLIEPADVIIVVRQNLIDLWVKRT